MRIIREIHLDFSAGRCRVDVLEEFVEFGAA